MARDLTSTCHDHQVLFQELKAVIMRTQGMISTNLRTLQGLVLTLILKRIKQDYSIKITTNPSIQATIRMNSGDSFSSHCQLTTLITTQTTAVI